MASQDNDFYFKRYGQVSLDQVRKRMETMEPPQGDKAMRLFEKLCNDKVALRSLISSSGDVTTVIKKILPESNSWVVGGSYVAAFNYVEHVRKMSFDNDKIWKEVIGTEIIMHDGESSVLSDFEKRGFCDKAVAWSRYAINCIRNNIGQAKAAKYLAFWGASGSGKTSSMLWTVKNLYLSKPCLNFYISCNLNEEQERSNHVFDDDYVHDCIQNYLEARVRSLTSDILRFDDLGSQWNKTTLVLVLDDVQGRYDHETLSSIPGYLKRRLGFEEVVLLVGSTALYHFVCTQPTGVSAVEDVRMMPLQERHMRGLLKHHLDRMRDETNDNSSLVNQLFEEMPVLVQLMSNHRCAYFTAVVLTELLGNKEYLPRGWAMGHSTPLVTMVACKYRASDVLKDKTPSECQNLMLQSLALVAGQKIFKANEGVDQKPEEGSLALQFKEVIELGLVERTILLERRISSWTYKVKVDGLYEFQMSPALTLVCLTSIFPWIGGISSVADHFQELVASLMVVMRYAQTNTIYHVHRLAQAAPCSGSDEDLVDYPEIPIDKNCFINDTQAPYSDLIVAGVPCNNKLPDDASSLAQRIAESKGVVEFPMNPILVQCKLTTTETAVLTPTNELAKMGLVVKDGKLASPDPEEAGFTEGSQQSKQYRSGQRLTNTWVRKNQQDNISVAFATNKSFPDCTLGEILDNATMMEAEGDHGYAWQKLYPIIQLVRTKNFTNVIERVRFVPVADLKEEKRENRNEDMD